MALLAVLSIIYTLVSLYTFFPFFLCGGGPTVVAYPALAETRTLVRLQDTWNSELRPALSGYQLRAASPREMAELGRFQRYDHLPTQPERFTAGSIQSRPVSHEFSRPSDVQHAFHGRPQPLSYHHMPSDPSVQLAHAAGGRQSGYRDGTGVFLPAPRLQSKVAKQFRSQPTYPPENKIPQRFVPLPQSTWVPRQSNPAPVGHMPPNPPEHFLPASVLQEIGHSP